MDSTPAATTDPVRERLGAKLSALAKKQRLVAEYILANPTLVLFASATEVAQAAGVDPATVVRLAQGLGFAGYPELRDALRRESSVPFPPVEQLVDGGTDAPEGDLAALRQQVRAQTLANVERTFETLDWRAIDTVLNHVLAARRVVVIGAGISRVLALHLHRVLQTAQIPTQVLEDWYDLLFDAATLDASDVVFGITAQRYSRVTIVALRLARDVGARTVLLTDSPFAPGARIAEVTLLFAPQAAAEFLSPVAGSAVIDYLAAGLGARVPDRVKRALALHVELAIAHELSYW